MRIIKCHIDNFGKIQNLDFDFVEGLNIINENNSWGKTTFSKFLKSMLFGLEYNTKKVNERKMYEPWQGGTFGGNLVIEVNKKIYRIERTFGKKDKEDTFALYNQTTGKESNDYTSNIGEEIFGIDRESFEKSIYVPQCEVETKMTDSLNAKIGNLSQIKGDINNFDIVKNRLEEKKKDYEGRSKKSTFSMTKDKISILKDELKKREENIESVALKEAFINDKKVEIELFKTKKEDCNKLLAIQSAQAKNTTLFNQANAALEETKTAMETLALKYNGQIASLETVEKLKQKQATLNSIKQQMSVLALDDSEQRKLKEYEELFSEGVPIPEVIALCKLEAENLVELKIKAQNNTILDEDKSKFEELKKVFSNQVPTEEEIDIHIEELNKANNLSKELADKELELAKSEKNYAQMKSHTSKIVMFTCIALGIIALVSGIIMVSTVNFMLGITVIVIGIVIAIIGMVFGIGNKEKNNDDNGIENLKLQIQTIQGKLEILESSYKGFVKKFKVQYSENIMTILMEIKNNLTEYVRLTQMIEKRQESAEKYNVRMNQTLQILEENLGNYSEKLGESDYKIIIDKIKDSINDLDSLNSKLEKYNKLAEDKSRQEEKFYQVASKYSDTLDLNQLEDDCKEYIRLSQTMRKLSEELDGYREKLYIQDGEAVSKTVDEIQKEIREYDAEIQRVSEEIAKYKRDAQKQYSIIEELEDIEDEIEYSENLLKEFVKKKELLNKTIFYLQKSKDQFSARYLGPMKDAFSKYLGMINGIEKAELAIEDFDIDIDLEPSLSYGSNQKKSNSLSKGYQDLVGFCIRLALIEAMYKNESPVLILDDPFVNMDEEKIENAMALIKQASKEYQILYFTCHHSRV